MYFFLKFPSFTLISGEEPYHGCTEFLTVTIITIIIIIKFFLNYFCSNLKWL